VGGIESNNLGLRVLYIRRNKRGTNIRRGEGGRRGGG
jgi:hypothetical protein